MYDEFETKTSLQYLQKVMPVVVEPICLIGGWGVYFNVNKQYRKRFGRDYLGSRDIDFGFFIDKNWSKEQLKKSSFARTLELLEKELKFELQGERLRKDFHIIEEKELSVETAKHVPLSFLFPLYIDLMVSNSHPDFKKVVGFEPFSEPMLEKVFKNPDYRTELKEFNKKLWLPKPEILLATKLNSVNQRSKSDKRLKDILDIIALTMFSEKPVKELKTGLFDLIPHPKAKQTIQGLKENELAQASSTISGITVQEIKTNLEVISVE
ncbi:MAG: hypothetical protein HYW50_04450 [Candidatus Diapherotrites archaeon]|nr:hypothetical protein [Candidatus Diapherotrites archaeon]